MPLRFNDYVGKIDGWPMERLARPRRFPLMRTCRLRTNWLHDLCQIAGIRAFRMLLPLNDRAHPQLGGGDELPLCRRSPLFGFYERFGAARGCCGYRQFCNVLHAQPEALRRRSDPPASATADQTA